MKTNFSLAINELNVLADTHFVLFNDNEITLSKDLAEALELPQVSKDITGTREKLLPFRCIYFHEIRQYELIP